jgi:hypothetical protein
MLTKKEFQQITTAINGMQMYGAPKVHGVSGREPYVCVASIVELLRQYIKEEPEND